MKQNNFFLCLFLLVQTLVFGQALKAGIYASDPKASVTTYVEQKEDLIQTFYAGKYETKYFKKNLTNLCQPLETRLLLLCLIKVIQSQRKEKPQW